MPHFDECKQKFNLLLARVGAHLNPAEKNLTILINEAAKTFGLPPYKISSNQGDHLPPPSETGPFFPCPICNKKTLTLTSLCRSCKESQNGRFKSKLDCSACSYSALSEKFVVTILEEFGYNFSSAQKSDIGIKTLTDEGLK